MERERGWRKRERMERERTGFGVVQYERKVEVGRGNKGLGGEKLAMKDESKKHKTGERRVK